MPNLNSYPLCMGILNLTPDSFSDGNPHLSVELAMKQVRHMIFKGASVIDVGAESTRPQAVAVSASEQISRLTPFLKAFRNEFESFPLSLDTRQVAVLEAVKAFNIQIVNDVSFAADLEIIEFCKRHQCIYILMHSRGDSVSMDSLTDYGANFMLGFLAEFRLKIECVLSFGLPESLLWIDPGFGYAKTSAQCMLLQRHLQEFCNFNFPVVVGLSRKRFLAEYIGPSTPLERDAITLKLNKKSLKAGAKIIRTHVPFDLTAKL